MLHITGIMVAPYANWYVVKINALAMEDACNDIGSVLKTVTVDTRDDSREETQLVMRLFRLDEGSYFDECSTSSAGLYLARDVIAGD